MDVSLIMFKEDGQRKEFALDLGKTVIGRQEECDLRIPLPEISRKHTLVIVSENAVTIRDLGSANGTYVNNKKISETELSPGDHIVIGPLVFTVQINGEPAEVRPVQTRLEARPTATAAGASRTGTGSAVDDDDDVFGSDDDPISALEALAGTDDTAALDMSDSFPGADSDE